MNYTISKSDNLNTHDYLVSCLNKARSSIMINYKNGKDEEDAAILEDFFSLLALDKPNKEFPIENIALENRRDVIQNQFGIPLGQLSNIDMSGIPFEEWVGEQSQKFINKAINEGMVQFSKVTKVQGTDLFNLYGKVVDPTLQAMYRGFYQAASESIANPEEAVRLSEKNISTEKYGKIDTANYYANLVVTIKDNYLQKILPLLMNCSFTDKGYMSQNDVHIGQTNPFRVFSAVALDSGQKMFDRWVRTLNCMDERSIHREHDAPKLFYELRYIYELTGYGGHYVREELNKIFSKGARFLIYYNNKKSLKVLPTSRIIQHLNRKLKAGDLIKSSSINKQYALYAKLKMRVINIDPIVQFELE